MPPPSSGEKSAKGLSLIGLNLGDHYLLLMSECKTAFDYWGKLQSLYKSQLQARTLQLRRELNNIKLGTGESIFKYISRAQQLQVELTACVHEFTAAEVVTNVLLGLPARYNAVVTVLTHSTVTLDVDSLRTHLQQAEQDLSKSHDSKESSLHSLLYKGLAHTNHVTLVLMEMHLKRLAHLEPAVRPRIVVQTSIGIVSVIIAVSGAKSSQSVRKSSVIKQKSVRPRLLAAPV
jgi:hypothetical protein